MIYLIISLVAAYLIGSFPTGYLIGRWAGKIDIRQHGSGNVGATNVFRVMGKKWGIFVLVCDMLKGLVAVTLVATIFYNLAPIIGKVYYQLLVGVSAICGHNWTVWLKFKGGKGVATSAGVFLGIVPQAVGLALIVWIIALVLSRYISLASIIAAATFPVFVYFLYRDNLAVTSLMMISVIIALLIIYTHRSNIKRLIAGNENKFTIKK